MYHCPVGLGDYKLSSENKEHFASSLQSAEIQDLKITTLVYKNAISGN